jgi:hypothetical protein
MNIFMNDYFEDVGQEMIWPYLALQDFFGVA